MKPERTAAPNHFRHIAAAMCLIAAHAPAMADDLATLEQDAFRQAVENVAPCVVQIETVGGKERVGEILVGTGPTTGVVFDADGYILSSSVNFAHEPSGIVVRLPEGRRAAAEVIATDHARKLTLLKIAAEGPLTAAESAGPARVGQWAIAVGRAFDPDRPNMAVGIVSAVDRVWGKAIQTDAAVSPNNYGGPLVDLDGRVLGILVPMSPASDDEIAGLEWYDSGIGFAVPAGDALEIAQRLKSGEDLRPGLLGVTLEGGDSVTAETIVAQIHSNSPGDQAGLKRGDRIVRVAGTPVARATEIRRQLARRYAGEKIALVVERQGQTLEAEATLVAELEPYQCPHLGILPSRTASAGEGQEAGSVEIRYVFPGSAAAEAGIAVGDRIAAIDGEELAGATALRQMIAARRVGDELAPAILAGGDRRTVRVKLGAAPDRIPDDVPPAATGNAGGQTEMLRLPEWPQEAKVYLPGPSQPDVPRGLLLWLRNPGQVTGQPEFETLKTHADNRQFLVVAPEPSSPDRWLPEEVEIVRAFLRLAVKRYMPDPCRIVVGGDQVGGSLALRVAQLERDTVRGLAVIDSLLVGPPLQDNPLTRISVLVGISEKGALSDRITRSVELLRQSRVPVVVLTRDSPPRPVNGEEAAAIARWIDCLDCI